MLNFLSCKTPFCSELACLFSGISFFLLNSQDGILTFHGVLINGNEFLEFQVRGNGEILSQVVASQVQMPFDWCECFHCCSCCLPAVSFELWMGFYVVSSP